MQQARNNYLIWSGLGAIAAALLHVAAIFGGPSWYRMIGATEPVIRLAAQGHPFPIIVCLMSAATLLACASFAFSGAGLIWRLPLLRTGLVIITLALLLHGIAFIPMVIWWPQQMMGLYDGDGVNTVLIVTSILCLAGGMGYALGTRSAWPQLSRKR